MHHASGVEEVGMHLDSLRNERFSFHLIAIGWKFDSDYFIDWAMQSNLPRAARESNCTLWLIILMRKVVITVLWPFALVFDCVDNKWKLLPGVEIIVHSGFNGDVTTQSVNQISF